MIKKIIDFAEKIQIKKRESELNENNDVGWENNEKLLKMINITVKRDLIHLIGLDNNELGFIFFFFFFF
jgi:hypothetical protein